MRRKRIKQMTAREVRRYIYGSRLDTFTILDVSSPPEYEIGHIPGAKLVPLPALPDKLKELLPEKTVIIY